MELWVTENHTANVRFSFKVDRQLYTGKSEYQRIDVFDSLEFGRVLLLDGYVMPQIQLNFMLAGALAVLIYYLGMWIKQRSRLLRDFVILRTLFWFSSLLLHSRS